MKNFIKSYWKLLLFFTVVGLFGGFFVGLYSFDSYSDEIKQQIIELGMDRTMVGLITAVQSAGYGLILGALGIVFSKKIGLWNDDPLLEAKPVFSAIAVSVLGGAVMIFSDIYFFGNYSQVIMDSYLVKPTVSYMIGAILYGGVIEEVMLRLFMMSLIALVLHKIFDSGRSSVSDTVFIVANIISAMLFAAGHIPATVSMIGLTPMILFRCFLLNGGIGLLFGRMYRKYGIQYAMLAHAGCHIVSKLIWILFI